MNPRDIKVGDSVWLGNTHSPQKRIEKVTRLTETQIIIIPKSGGELRYYRKNGLAANGLKSYWITGIATENDIKVHEEAQRQLREEQKRTIEQARKLEEKRYELNTLFGGRAFVQHSEGKWHVEFEAMPEAAVRLLAEQTSQRSDKHGS